MGNKDTDHLTKIWYILKYRQHYHWNQKIHKPLSDQSSSEDLRPVTYYQNPLLHFFFFSFPSENLMNCYINMSYHCKSYIILSQYSTGEIHFVNPLPTITGFSLVSNKNIKEN